MQGASAGGSPEGEAGAGERLRGPGRSRRVRFRMPHTTIAVPSCRDEEQLFYRRLDALGALGPDGFAPLFAAEGWSEVTGERRAAGAGLRRGRSGSHGMLPVEDRLLRKRVRWRTAVWWSGTRGSVSCRARATPCRSAAQVAGRGARRARRAQPVLRARRRWNSASPPCGPGRSASSSPPLPTATAARAGRTGGPGWPTGRGRGDSGCRSRREPDVPPEAPLVFEVTLLEVRDGPDPKRLPPAARLRLGAQKRERGNVHFARGDFAAALLSYRLALSALEGSGEEQRDGTGVDLHPASPPGPHEEELLEQRVKCLNNCAAAARRLQRGAEALAAVEEALRLSPDNGTALLRRGQLLAEEGRDEEAARVLRRALELDPASKPVHAELSRLAKRRARTAEEPRDRPRPPPSSGCVWGRSRPAPRRPAPRRTHGRSARREGTAPPEEPRSERPGLRAAPARTEEERPQRSPPPGPTGAAPRLLAPAQQLPALSPPPAERRP
ncbi:serine/arginine repetitive matrix protein 1-like [Tympanuchus pallidicinctus]|uniref:serine/arginine repetitive matrix protein 1-like n=1 Tax=Tympanuchus pallidicinctus TaxID=109042 RepID=UPI002286D8F1|nr:serine/arginine repetitive matrix protein 1-like [Tympanuchus pallidicinctus]